MSKQPDSSLIICSRDRHELLADTVRSVLQGNTLPTEIVIVDQSRQPFPEIDAITREASCEIRYLWSQTAGLSRARNIAFDAARYDALVIIDDDMFVEQGWYAAILTALQRAGRKSIISGQVRPYLSGGKGSFVPSTITDERPAVYKGRVGKDVLYAGNMALYRTAIQEVGPFDEKLGPGSKFPGSEDSDLGFRLLEAGYCLVYAPQAVVYHRAWRSNENYLPLRWSYGLGRGAFYAKYLHMRDRYMLGRMFTDVKGHMLSFPGRLRKERLKAYGDIVISGGILVGAAKWLITQRLTAKK